MKEYLQHQFSVNSSFTHKTCCQFQILYRCDWHVACYQPISGNSKTLNGQDHLEKAISITWFCNIIGNIIHKESDNSNRKVSANMYTYLGLPSTILLIG